MVRNKSNRYDHDIRHGRARSLPSRVSNFRQCFANIWTQPRLRRRAAATLIDELPVRMQKPFRHQPRGLVKLSLVLAAAGHCHRNAMGCEEELSILAAFRRKLVERSPR